MADYKSIYSGEEIDTAVGRALTLTQLDGTVISDKNASYIVMATVKDGAYQYTPVQWNNLPTQVPNKTLTINNYGADSSTTNYTLDAGRIPFAETVSDEAGKRQDSVYNRIIQLEKLADATDTSLKNHITLIASTSTTIADNDSNYYHISGTLIKRWNTTNINLTNHINNTACHLNPTQAQDIANAKIHYNDINDPDPVFKYHLKAGERETLNKWMSDSSNIDSILYLQTQLKKCLTASFQVSTTAPTNKNILWIDSENKVLKYYSDVANDWVIIPVAYS